MIKINKMELNNIKNSFIPEESGIQFDSENFQMISQESDKYDQKVLDLVLRVQELEAQIKEIKKESNRDRTLFRKLMDTTSYVNTVVDNFYFLGKIAMPLYLYYRFSK